MSFLAFASPLGARHAPCWRKRVLVQLSSSFHTGHVLYARPKTKPAQIPEKWMTPGVELPPIEEWWKIYKFSEKRKRKTVANPETAKRLAELYVPEGSKDKVIVEAWAGPGVLTRALLNLPRDRISKIIVLEEEPSYNAWLKPLAEIDDRIHIVEKDAFLWTTYTHIDSEGLLKDVKTVDWTAGVHPQLQYIAQIPNNVLGEQLIAQLCRAIPDRSWLFKYGRVPMDVITTATMWERLSTPPGPAKTRCKVGVMTEATADLSITLPGEELKPVTDHFFYPTTRSTPVQEFAALNVTQQPGRIVPKEDVAIGPGSLEAWDYVTRNLFITKATAIKKSIGALGPGAPSLLKKLDDESLPADQRVDLNLSAVRMTVKDWKNVVRVFEEWPFRPEHLSINTSLVYDERKP